MKLAVTTANGKLGSAVIRQLTEDFGTENIIGIARSPEKAIHLGVEIRKGDYDIEEDFNSALEGVDNLLMISGLADAQTRIEQHRKIIRAAKKSNVKKIVYTGILGSTEKTGFAPMVRSMRQTEQDLQSSGLSWIVGRNGMYIEADLNYIPTYEKEGGILNSAGQGRTAYTSYHELARAYAKLLTNNHFNNRVYHLTGTPITQSELAQLINHNFNTDLQYQFIPIPTFYQEKITAYGEFSGNIVGGIYEGINLGYHEVSSDMETILGRPHNTPQQLIQEFKLKSL